MKNIYINIISVLSILILATSCSDFLDVDSREKIDVEDGDLYSPEQLLTGVYGKFSAFSYTFAYMGITEIISDNSDKGSSSTDDGKDKHLLDALTYTVSTDSFEEMWKHWYKSVGAATLSIGFTKEALLTDKNLEARYIGEAQYLRALNYFYLVRGWGDVPIQEIHLIDRVSVDSVYNYIKADLVSAEAFLPKASQYEAKDKGRATQGAAQGLLAKVHLYQKNWQGAYDYANKVINSGEYALLPNYIDIWKAEFHNSSESVFEFQAKGSDGTIAQGIKQYSQVQAPRGGTGWGWGFNTPSDDLLKAYNDAGDVVRRDGTIIFRGQSLWDGREVKDTQNAMYNYKAYSSSGPSAEWNDKSLMYMRIAEVYLIKAEAANELGNTAEALAALNVVRDRAKLANVTVTGQDELRKIIWNERRLELAMEHDRWFDIIRTGQAEEAMRVNGKTFIKGKHDLFPIPNAQMIQTPEMVQNPNW